MRYIATSVEKSGLKYEDGDTGTGPEILSVPVHSAQRELECLFRLSISVTGLNIFSSVQINVLACLPYNFQDHRRLSEQILESWASDTKVLQKL